MLSTFKECSQARDSLTGTAYCSITHYSIRIASRETKETFAFRYGHVLPLMHGKIIKMRSNSSIGSSSTPRSMKRMNRGQQLQNPRKKKNQRKKAKAKLRHRERKPNKKMALMLESPEAKKTPRHLRSRLPMAQTTAAT